MFCFPETQPTRNVFSEARFVYLDEKKKQILQPLITQTKGAIKNILKRGEAWLKPRILHKAIHAHLHKRNSQPAQLLFLWNFTLIVARYYRHAEVQFFFISCFFCCCCCFCFFFQHRNKTKVANFTKHKRETSFLHKLSHKCRSHLFHYFIIVNYDFIKQSLLTSRRKIVKSWDS